MTENLAERVERLKTETAAATADRQKEARHSRFSRMQQDIATSGKFLYQVSVALLWIKRYIANPIYNRLKWLVFKLFHYYKRLWFLSVYRRDSDKELVFSKTRAGLFLLASGIFIWFFILPISGAMVDATLYLVTAERHETIYLFGSQEIDPETGMHNVEGASHSPWSESDAIYFRTVDNLFNNLWSLTHGKGLFFPEYVAAAVPYGVSKCSITSYGFRFRFHLIKMYSYLLSVNCVPFTSSK